MYVDTKETAFLHDLSKPSLEALSHVLRHPEKWPEGFEWDYEWCSTCAMGLAGLLWNQLVSDDPNEMLDRTASLFAARRADMAPIFSGDGNWIPLAEGCTVLRNLKSVTPDIVADEIDKYLASRAG